MKLLGKNFSEISVNTIEELVSSGIPESEVLEYKSELYGSEKEQKREFLKDITAFANTSGGYLIIGVIEESGVATNLSPIDCDVDKELQRLESIALSGIEPRLYGLQITAIKAAHGSIILVYAPGSANRPHRVTAFGHNKFYARHSSGVYELNTEQLRREFTLRMLISERMIRFQQERIRMLSDGKSPITSPEYKGKVVIHILPESSIDDGNAINLEDAYAQQQLFHPPFYLGFSPSYNFEGVLLTSESEDCYSYTQIFRNGAIEAVAADIVHDVKSSPTIFPNQIEKIVFEHLPNYLRGISTLNIPPPYFVAISLQDVHGAHVQPGGRFRPTRRPKQVAHDPLLLPPRRIDSEMGETELRNQIRHALDVLWNVAGYSRSPNFDADGNWHDPG